MIPGGYYIKARCIKDSWVAHAAPVVREVWDYLLREANHADKKYHGYTVKRGQLFRSYAEIRDALSWRVGARSQRYSDNQMKHTMKLLRNERMIELKKLPRGNLITVLNYSYYQDPNSYEANKISETQTNHPRINDESTSESTSESTREIQAKELKNKEIPSKTKHESTSESTGESPMNHPRINQSSTSINKNDKNDKNDKNKEYLKDIYCRVVSYLNDKTGKSFKDSSKKTQSLINARLSEGFTEQDIYTVIDTKTSKWLFDVKMSEFLRPETLFGSKFESYLNEKGGNNGKCSNFNKGEDGKDKKRYAEYDNAETFDV
jgi:uncharacterized phage protein (TIGR02220 family)